MLLGNENDHIESVLLLNLASELLVISAYVSYYFMLISPNSYHVNLFFFEVVICTLINYIFVCTCVCVRNSIMLDVANAILSKSDRTHDFCVWRKIKQIWCILSKKKNNNAHFLCTKKRKTSLIW